MYRRVRKCVWLGIGPILLLLRPSSLYLTLSAIFPVFFHESARVPSLHRPVPSAVTTLVPRRSLSCMRCRHTGHYGEAAMPFPNFSRRRGLWTSDLYGDRQMGISGWYHLYHNTGADLGFLTQKNPGPVLASDPVHTAKISCVIGRVDPCQVSV